MATFKELRARALSRVIVGLNRADELGGEARDFIAERVLRDERYVRARKRLGDLIGRPYTSQAEREAEQADRDREVAAAAPVPLADQPATESQALGDPAIPAQIYGRSSCPWTGRAITLFEQLKVDYDFTDLDDPDHEHLSSRLIPETRQKTVPWVYVRGQFVGGFNALDELRGVGQLEYLLMTEEQRKAANPAMAKIAVAPRPDPE